MSLPFSSPPNFASGLKPSGEKEEKWFIFAGDQLLIKEDHTLPSQYLFSPKPKLYLGTHNNQHLFSTEIDSNEKLPEGWTWSTLRQLHGSMDESTFAIAGRALQLIDWDRSNRYCGQCATPTLHRENERCRECPSCGQLSYPKMAIAVLALIKKEDKILLARGVDFPGAWYSVLAGFVDPGETLEQCVAREVFEEVGLKVKNIRYFASQPWPFSRSMMIGFTCDWQEGEISVDPSEIEVADWFDINSLPELPPLISIARFLIDSAFETK